MASCDCCSHHTPLGVEARERGVLDVAPHHDLTVLAQSRCSHPELAVGSVCVARHLLGGLADLLPERTELISRGCRGGG